MERRDLRYFTCALFAGPVLWGAVVLAWSIHGLRTGEVPTMPVLEVGATAWIFVQTAVCWYLLLGRDLGDEVRQHGWTAAIEGIIFSPFPLVALFALMLIPTVGVMCLPPPLQIVVGAAAIIASSRGLRLMRASTRARLVDRLLPHTSR